MIRVLDNDSLTPIFESAQPMKVEVKPTKKATRFQVESGATRSDHVITMPIEINIDFMLVDDDAEDQFDEMRTFFDAERLVTIQTNFGTFVDMLIEAMPHTESAQIASGASVPVKFLEWREIEPEYGGLVQVKNPDHSNTVQRGRQSGQEEENEKAGSLLHRMVN